MLPFPIFFLTAWLLVGMLTTMSAWATMTDELEMALGEEDEEIRGALRVVLTVVFVLAWPVVVVDMMK